MCCTLCVWEPLEFWAHCLGLFGFKALGLRLWGFGVLGFWVLGFSGSGFWGLGWFRAGLVFGILAFGVRSLKRRYSSINSFLCKTV